MGNGHPLFVIFFMLGAVLFFIGLAMRLFLYWRGQWDLWPLVKGCLFNPIQRQDCEADRNNDLGWYPPKETIRSG